MNYNHLHYFWVVATEGSMSRAAERLGVAVQTISSQVRALERSLGAALFRPEGRGLALTPAGQAAWRQADEMFRLGERLPELVREADGEPILRLAVGLVDGLPKLLVHALLTPILNEPRLRLQCLEDRPEALLAALALHRLDLVLTDRLPGPNPNLKVYAHRLGSSGLSWWGTPNWAERARDRFPHSLGELPVLLPSPHAAVRMQVDRWFASHGLRPQVVGEFQDSALLKTFGASGLGLFPAVDRVQDDLRQRYGVERIGALDDVQEEFFALSTERVVHHPLVKRLMQPATGPETAA
ncbi:LysR family transcriptional activator of nhaA [Inhella inkyongensis]|uniref:LysR family transcriptional activator of nhaA n=1 Tax=Inhella inkyongensis TaxID=392593 RepID=A0A840S1K4_9BURK|nr:LysR family transcriptional regulator [Inhella inkyongensis]MBB5204165.1 LysR family transcriptional activator of nhaA [Inhella inkyongensis]